MTFIRHRLPTINEYCIICAYPHPPQYSSVIKVSTAPSSRSVQLRHQGQFSSVFKVSSAPSSRSVQLRHQGQHRSVIKVR